jgi:cation transport regulator ChaB
MSKNSNAKMNEALKWIFDMISLMGNDEITIPSSFTEQVKAVKEVLASDISGLVNSVLDFSINCASVDFTIESNNKSLTDFINSWFKKINYSLIGKIPTGIKALSKENYKERWKNSSLLLLRTEWNDVNINGSTFNLPTKMWFIDGVNIKVEDEGDSRIIGKEKYYLRINDNEKDNKLLPASKEELIFVQKPYENWTSLEPIPFLIRRGLYRNLKNYALINKKSEKIVSKALEYLLLMKKGSENLALRNIPEFIYSSTDLNEVKDKIKKIVDESKTNSGLPYYVTNFDTEIEHLIPDYKKVLDQSLYTNVEKRLLSGLGLVEIVEGTSSSRREAILNPRPFIKEVESGVEDFISLLEDVMKVIVEKNIVKHPKLFSEESDIQLHYTPIRDFISDSIRDHLRSMYDRGVLSKETYGEVVGGVDLDIEVKRRKQETENKLDETMYAPVIQNTENKQADLTPFKKVSLTKETTPVSKQGPEAKNFKGALEVYIIKCKKCSNEFDFEKTPETNMGLIICPKCKVELTEKEYELSKIEISKVYEEAPYKNINELPEQVKVLPSDGQSLWMRVFNESYPKGEDYARKVAWSVVKKVYKKDKDGNWVRKSRTKGEDGEWINLEETPTEDILDNIIKLQEIELRDKQIKVANKVLGESD